MRYFSQHVVAEMGFWPDGSQWVIGDDGLGIGLPLMEFTVRVGDILMFEWPTEAELGRPIAVQINNAPWLPYAAH